MADSYSFSITGYTGYEDAILAMRNRNRKTLQTKEHFDWRYLGEFSEIAPLVFWMRNKEGECIGMASLIFRPYFVRGQRQLFGVLGDISVNREHRGSGLGTKLFKFINSHIQERQFSCAVVMPGPAAERALISSGWQTVARLAPFVCVINPYEKLKKLFKVGLVAAAASTAWRVVMNFRLASEASRGTSLTHLTSFDEEFQRFWESFPKSDRVMRDRSLSVLNWRYLQQPGKKYSIGKFHRDGKFIGYIIWEVSEADSMCFISDFIVSDAAFARPAITVFLREIFDQRSISTVWLAQVESSVIAEQIRSFFFKRQPLTAFQVYHPSDKILTDADAWLITAGDKDA